MWPNFVFRNSIFQSVRARNRLRNVRPIWSKTTSPFQQSKGNLSTNYWVWINCFRWHWQKIDWGQITEHNFLRSRWAHITLNRNVGALGQITDLLPKNSLNLCELCDLRNTRRAFYFSMKSTQLHRNARLRSEKWKDELSRRCSRAWTIWTAAYAIFDKKFKFTSATNPENLP